MAHDTDVDHTERRAEARDPIARRVVFSGVRGEELLRQGLAVDISPSGILIQTTQPDLVGRHLELEIQAGTAVSPGNVTMVRAEVMWVRPLPAKGEHAMGLRFLQSVPSTDATGMRYVPAGREESAQLAASIQRSLDAMEPAATLELSSPARQRARRESPAPADGTKRRRRSRWLLWLFLFLVLAGLIMVLTIGLLWRLEELKQGGSARSETRPAAGAIDGLPAEGKEDETPGPGERLMEERIDQIEAQGPAYYVNRGSYLLAQGRFPAAAQAFKTAQQQPGATPIERYVAGLGEAEALARSDQPEAALVVLESPFAELDNVPESWRLLKEQFRDALLSAPGAPASRAAMVNAFTFAAPAGADSNSGGSGGNDPSEIRIEIDTTRYLLNVLENNSIQAVYPVGLGARSQTPEGRYTVINKLEEPDWYNNGDVVPAGDPENELGSRWLGLGDDSGPTQLGIHATDDLASIGANQSRGCIRMRPADVEDLFERIPVGTPVYVRAL